MNILKNNCFLVFIFFSCPNMLPEAVVKFTMGDSHAVEFAQQAHFNVLRQMGDCVRNEEFVSYRKVFPRGKTMEFLSIDDHMIAQVCALSEHKAHARLRATIIFEACDVAYPKVGLVQHPKQRRRDVTSETFLGADVNGLDGLISAPRHRIGVLSRLTSVIVRRGCCSSSLLSAVLGFWIHLLMFRRPLFAILQAVFVDARREPRDEVFALQRESLNELLCLALLGAPCWTVGGFPCGWVHGWASDLRTPFRQSVSSLGVSSVVI